MKSLYKMWILHKRIRRKEQKKPHPSFTSNQAMVTKEIAMNSTKRIMIFFFVNGKGYTIWSDIISRWNYCLWNHCCNLAIKYLIFGQFTFRWFYWWQFRFTLLALYLFFVVRYPDTKSVSPWRQSLGAVVSELMISLKEPEVYYVIFLGFDTQWYR